MIRHMVLFKQKLTDPATPQDQLQGIKAEMTVREKLLLPIYSQIAIQFADLHDRAGRMKAKGVIRQALRWQNARRFFYWRLRRRLNEEYILKRFAAAAAPSHDNPAANSLTRTRGFEMLKHLSKITNWENDDMSAATWYEENRPLIGECVEKLKSEGIAKEIATLMRKDKEGGIKGVMAMLSTLETAEKLEVLKMLGRA